MVKNAFDHCVDDYSRYRPSYPAEALDILAEKMASRAVCRVADVGAGTGIFARLLAARGWNVVAVEPSFAMLSRVGDPAVLTLCAAAEATGLGDRSVDMVTAAQAFHWFNPPFALSEFARVLRPGGVLAMCWNNRDATRSAFVGAYESLIAHYNTRYEREYRVQDWPGKIATVGAFEPAEYHRVEHVWRLSADAFVGFSRSVSYIRNVLPREQMPRFEDDLRALMAEHFGEDDCAVPLRTDLWTARRRAVATAGLPPRS